MGVGFVCMHAYAYKTRGVWGQKSCYLNLSVNQTCSSMQEQKLED